MKRIKTNKDRITAIVYYDEHGRPVHDLIPDGFQFTINLVPNKKRNNRPPPHRPEPETTNNDLPPPPPSSSRHERGETTNKTKMNGRQGVFRPLACQGVPREVFVNPQQDQQPYGYVNMVPPPPPSAEMMYVTDTPAGPLMYGPPPLNGGWFHQPHNMYWYHQNGMMEPYYYDGSGLPPANNSA
jgi:hypothetical protein